jgi:hypothetical protein
MQHRAGATAFAFVFGIAGILARRAYQVAVVWGLADAVEVRRSIEEVVSFIVE